MTPDEHRRLGHALGYPPCCIEQFVSELGTGQALRRGSIEAGHRTPEEAMRAIDAADDDIRHRVRRLVLGSDDAIMRYVPCDGCADPADPRWRRPDPRIVEKHYGCNPHLRTKEAA